MENIIFKLIESDRLTTILPLLKELNTHTSEELLLSRIEDMNLHANYKCVGLFIDERLIGVSGLWHLTRHYCGRTIEPDHVIINNSYRNKGLGKLLFKWIADYTSKIGYETIELNTYLANIKSHQFYENEGFTKLGFHYIKKL